MSIYRYLYVLKKNTRFTAKMIKLAAINQMRISACRPPNPDFQKRAAGQKTCRGDCYRPTNLKLPARSERRLGKRLLALAAITFLHQVWPRPGLAIRGTPGRCGAPTAWLAGAQAISHANTPDIVAPAASAPLPINKLTQRRSIDAVRQSVTDRRRPEQVPAGPSGSRQSRTDGAVGRCAGQNS